MNLKVGTICFVKIKGYSPWPARINSLPSDIKLAQSKVPVFFYGTHQIALVYEKDVYENNDSNAKKFYKPKIPKFSLAVDEMQNNPHIYEYGYDEEALEFLSYFYKFDFDKAKEEFKHVNENWKNVYEIPKKSSRVSLEQGAVKRLKQNIPTCIIDESQIKPCFVNIEKDSQISIEEDNCKDTIQSELNIIKKEGENPNTVVDEISNSIQKTSRKRPIRASAEKFRRNLHSFTSGQNSISMSNNEEEVCNKFNGNDNISHKSVDIKTKLTDVEYKVDKPVKRRVIGKATKKSKPKDSIATSLSPVNNIFFPDETKPNPIKIPPVNTERLHQETPTKNAQIKKSKLERAINSKLSIIDQEIRQSLCIGTENIVKCNSLLDNILEWSDITLSALCRTPDIVTTIKKCSRYKKDAIVKEKACEVYLKFYKLLEHAGLEEKIEAGQVLLKKNGDEGNAAELLTKLLSTPISIPQMTHPTSSTTSDNVIVSSPVDNNLMMDSTSTMTGGDDHYLLQSYLDPDQTDIKPLLNNGQLKIIDSYDADEFDTMSDDNNLSPQVNGSSISPKYSDGNNTLTEMPSI